MVELADALASGASGSNLVRVQVPPSAPDRASDYPMLFFIFASDTMNTARDTIFKCDYYPQITHKPHTDHTEVD